MAESMSESNSTTIANELGRASESTDTTPSTVSNCSLNGRTSSSSTTVASSTNHVPDTTEIGVLIGGKPSRSSPNVNAESPAMSTTAEETQPSPST